MIFSSWSTGIAKSAMFPSTGVLGNTNAMALGGAEVVHRNALKNAEGTRTCVRPILCWSECVYMGPAMIMIAESLRAQRRSIFSSVCHTPRLSPASCGHILASEKQSVMASGLHFWSAAGTMCPRSNPELE